MPRIQISAEGIRVIAELNDSPTAEAIWNALPLEARGSTWGDEIYFSIPVQLPLAEDAKGVVELGDLG
ncbi:MAG: cyclophilin-like fold protein, partial [Anaerolineae bacterium]